MKEQLYHERTEGRRKLIAEKRKGGEGKDKNISQRWKNILPQMSASNSFKSKRENSQQSTTIYASIAKQSVDNNVEPEQNSDPDTSVKLPNQIHWTSKEKQILRKIQVLERPSMASVNPTSLR